MPRYAAFLRAINVGGRVVTMGQLRKPFEDAGLEEVETFIASGNVIFHSRAKDAAKLEGAIERRLEAALGYGVATFVRSMSELRAAAERAPFPASAEAAAHALHVAFLRAAPPAAAVAALMKCRSDVDDFHVHGREAYWLAGVPMSQTSFSGAKLERALGMPATLRNVTTVRRMAAKFAG
jgi:uncharacterized protein (DUF1697 family)